MIKGSGSKHNKGWTMKKYQKFEGHTPGPWEVKGKFTTVTKSNGEKIIHKTGPEGQSVQSQQRNYERRLVDSNLIAAAPDLLAENKALREFVGRCKQREYGVEAATVARYLLAELDREGI